MDTVEIDGAHFRIGSAQFCVAAADHASLAALARSDRLRLGHDVENSFVWCTRCGMVISLA